MTMIISAAGCAKAETAPQEKPSDANTARDGNIAIQEEFDAAKAKNTVAAYELFIARHPNHPLAAQAKAERAGLTGKNPQKDPSNN